MTSNNKGIKFGACLLVGLGGIGSNLIEQLARLLMYHPNGTWVFFAAEGDSFEEKNLQRQIFSPRYLGMNKAQAICSATNAIPNVVPVCEYMNRDTMTSLVTLIQNYTNPLLPLLVVAAVDRHASRKAMLQVLDELVPSYCWVCPSNEYESVQISLHIKRKGQDVTVHPFQRYTDIANPTDIIPGGCGEEAPSTPQLLTTNYLAATSTLLLVQALLDGKPVHDELVGNIRQMKLKPVGQAIAL